MPLTVTPNDDAVITALRGFLLAVVPDGFEVVQAQDNRVPEPKNADFILTTPLIRTRLGTNRDEITDVPGSTSTVIQPTQMDYQLDIHGPNSADAAQIVSTLMRDEYAVDFFTVNSPGISPLYAGNPRQLVFVNSGEQQFENRWTVEVSLQADPAIVFPQQYATDLVADVISVEERFPAS